MSAAITKGTERNALSRIYDRLRKRSYRRRVLDGYEQEDIKWTWFPLDATGHHNEAPWAAYDHAAYILGVKDALNAVEEAGLLKVEAELLPLDKTPFDSLVLSVPQDQQ